MPAALLLAAMAAGMAAAVATVAFTDAGILGILLAYSAAGTSAMLALCLARIARPARWRIAARPGLPAGR